MCLFDIARKRFGYDKSRREVQGAKTVIKTRVCKKRKVCKFGNKIVVKSGFNFWRVENVSRDIARWSKLGLGFSPQPNIKRLMATC